MNIWKEIREWFGRRNKEYYQWALKNETKRISENYNINYSEIGLTKFLTILFMLFTLLLSIILLFYPHQVITFVKLYLGLIRR
jgi:hypothetical protein